MKYLHFAVNYISQITKKRFYIEILINLFKQFFNIFYGVFFLRMLINGIKLQNKIPTTALITLLFMFLLNISFWFVKHYSDNIYSPISNLQIDEKIQLDISKATINVPLEEFSTPSYLDKSEIICQKSSSSMIGVIVNLGALFGHILAISMTLSYIISFDLMTLIISLSPFFLTLLLRRIIANLKHQLITETAISERKKSYAKRVFYLPQYAKELRLTNISSVIKKIYNDGVDNIINVYRKKGFKIAFFSSVDLLVGDAFILIASIVYILIKMRTSSDIFVGDFIALSQAITFFNWNLDDLSNDFRSLYECIPYIKDFKDYISNRYNKESNIDIDENNFSIEFKNVNFSYKKNERPTLCNINLKINKGEKIAIVGENGAGKTTLIHLLMNLYHPDSGSVEINGIDINEYSANELNKFYVSLFQDFCLYPLTIKENVTLGNSNIKDFDIIQNLKVLNLYSKIGDPSLYYTNELSEHGINLSGGEQQRLAFMRILTSDSPCIILDEPTSSLDVINEASIYKMIFNKFPDKTIIFISHKLSTTSFVDKIIFLKDGRVKKIGTHKDLMANCSEYNELYNIQNDLYHT